MCFSANVGRHFLKTNSVGRHFGSDFQGFCRNFRQIKTFEGALAPPASSPPTPLASLLIKQKFISRRVLPTLVKLVV